MAEPRQSHKRALIITIACVLLVVILSGAGVLIWMTRGLSTYSKMTIGNVDFSRLPDGTYQGTFNGGRFSNTVEVTVTDHKVTAIKVVKDVTFKDPARRRQIIDSVIKAQSLKVDTITGATATGKAYLKAIENALSGAK